MSSRTVRWSFAAWLAVIASGGFAPFVTAQEAPTGKPAAKPKPGAGRPAAGRGETRPPAGERSEADERSAATERPAKGPAKPAASAAPVGPQEPFKLTPQEEAQLDKLLLAWQQKTNKLTKFRCEFDMWITRGNAQADGKNTPEQKTGKIWYSHPDKGRYEISGDGGDKWICDGRSIFIYNDPAKKVEENVLPPELQGKAISEGPLPFLFGAEAAKQKRRYYLRIVTPKNAQQEGHIWIEAHPKFQADAANFRQATIILNAKDLLPFALEIIDPTGKNRTAYQFKEVRINELLANVLWGNVFVPDVPKGWTKIVLNPAEPPAKGTEGATRPRETTGRKPGATAAPPNRK